MAITILLAFISPLSVTTILSLISIAVVSSYIVKSFMIWFKNFIGLKCAWFLNLRALATSNGNSVSSTNSASIPIFIAASYSMSPTGICLDSSSLIILSFFILVIVITIWLIKLSNP